MKSFDNTKKKITQIYFVIIFSVLLLYVHNGYFDILEAKRKVLMWSAFFYTVIMLMIMILEIGYGKIHFRDILHGLNRLDYCLLGFATISLISGFISDTPATAFWGSESCGIGSFIICLLCISCVMMSKYLCLNKWMIGVLLFSGIIVCIGCITDCFDIDIMGWHQNIAASHYDYLTTVGNRDVLDGFFALLLPFVAVLFVFENNLLMTILYAIFLFFGFMGLYIAKNDGNLLVFGSGIFLVYYILREKIDTKRVIYLIFIFILSSIAIQIICIHVDPVNVTGNTIMGLFLRLNGYYFFAFLAALIWSMRNKKINLDLKKIWVVFSVIIVIILFAAVVINFNYTFASNRAYIWSYGLETFQKSPVLRKIFGWGPDCYGYAVYKTVGERIIQTWPEDNYVGSAHNEIIQYLITTGILGAVSYIGVYLLSIMDNSTHDNVYGMAAKTAIFAYFCQALGNNPASINYGMLFVMFAIAGSGRIKEDWE